MTSDELLTAERGLVCLSLELPECVYDDAVRPARLALAEYRMTCAQLKALNEHAINNPEVTAAWIREQARTLCHALGLSDG